MMTETNNNDDDEDDKEKDYDHNGDSVSNTSHNLYRLVTWIEAMSCPSHMTLMWQSSKMTSVLVTVTSRARA